MIAKILKSQLFVLFLLTLISCVAFYFHDAMPDNYMEITSEAESIGFFSYYFSSFVNLINFYTGPWIFIPFIIFTVLYVVSFSRREYKIDCINIIPLIIASLFFSFVFFPISLGAGILFLLNHYVSFWGGFFIACSSTILLIAGIFRASFVKVIENVGGRIESIFKNSKLETRQRSLPYNEKKNYKAKFMELFSFARWQEKYHFLRILKKSKRKENLHKPIVHNLASAEEKGSIAEERALPDNPSGDGEQRALLSFGKKKTIERTAAPTSPASSLRRSKVAQRLSHDNYFELVKCIGKKRTENQNINPEEKYFQQIVDRIDDKLAEFKIDGNIIDILKGPVVDTFELELGAGVKVSKVTSSAEDLSLALYGAPIRIVYPMKGRTTVGIEVPRNPREIIYLDEVLNTREFQENKNQLPIAMGKDAFGAPFIVDLAAMPHMLVAGATGAGKSVFINTLLVSLLVKKSPQQMKLILIDPKQLELALYASLPHLVMPVVVDPKRAAISLLWAVQEMERRYSILKEFGVRHITSFNEKLETAGPELISKIHDYYDDGDEYGHQLPYIVIVVDEFADLILTKAGKEIENNICRLAGKARAAGIHLVLATQRPSVDVITGLIKSNFPTRVSFRVTTSIDSRTILNAVGAEKLLGKGDMLYKYGVETSRVHSSFVDEKEIEALTDNLTTLQNNFSEKVMDFLENGGELDSDPYAYGSHINSVFSDASGDEDELYNQAVTMAMEHRAASASMLQRRLKVGYNRAANLIDMMEEKGVIGPAQGSKPRQVFASPE